MAKKTTVPKFAAKRPPTIPKTDPIGQVSTLRTVNFVIKDDDIALPAVIRPALVIGGTEEAPDLFVLCHPDECPGHAAMTVRSAPYDAEKSPGTWH